MIREMESFEFNLKTKTYFGNGVACKLGEYLKNFNLDRIGIIIDAHIFGLPTFQKLLDGIKKQYFTKIKIWKYDLGKEPDYDSLDKVRRLFVDKQGKPIVDCFVGIGGGSVMDFAKGLSTLVTNPKPSLYYRGFPTDLNPSLPVVAVPTIAGTGSEVTYNAVFIDKNDKKKLGINTMNNFPLFAVLDPSLTLSAPISLIVSTGMDALVHTMESYVATKANELTRTFASKAFMLLFNNLPKIVKNTQDLKIRANLMLGSYLAGISLMNSGSGPTGALSYSLGVHFEVPHGKAGAVFLPYIIEHNVEAGYDYSPLFDLIEGVDDSLNKNQKNNQFSQKFFTLYEEIGIPLTLTAFGVNEKNRDILLKESENYVGAFRLNPMKFTVDDAKKLIKKLSTTKV